MSVLYLLAEAGADTGFLAEAKTVISYMARGVEFAAAIVIGLAALQAIVKSFVLFVHPQSPAEKKTEIRMVLGRWLAVALELELGADILNTAVSPSWGDIGKLAAIATLRTALNYFLEREIEAESKPEQRHADEVVQRGQEMGNLTHPATPQPRTSGD